MDGNVLDIHERVSLFIGWSNCVYSMTFAASCSIFFLSFAKLHPRLHMVRTERIATASARDLPCSLIFAMISSATALSLPQAAGRPLPIDLTD